jgi:hypothetical protein
MAPSSRVFRLISIAAVSAAACGAVLLASSTAHAQRVYVYGPGYGPPPPPPPAYGYGYGPRPYYYQEPRNAFDLGFDVEGVLPLNPPQAPAGAPGGPNGQAAIGGGAGFKIRAGDQMRFPGLRFTPELGYAYDHLWSADNLGDSYDWSMNRFFAGARLGFGRIIVPVIYAHLGYGWRQVSSGWGDTLNNDGGLAFDVGGAIDFRLAPHVSFGAHLEYTQIVLSTDTPQWLAIGGHADFTF